MTPHGEEGHVNTCTRDHESVVTGFGTHDRVTAFLPKGEECYVGINRRWNLGFPTEKQIRKVMRDDQGIRGRWKLDRVEPWGDDIHFDVYFRRA